MSETIDPFHNYLLLEADGQAARLPGGEAFWEQLMSGETTDPLIRQLQQSRQGRLVSAFRMDADWTNWEMHPQGDELLVMLRGRATFLLELPDGLRETELHEDRMLVVPRGVWHTARISSPIQLLAITPGYGTQHKPA